MTSHLMTPLSLDRSRKMELHDWHKRLSLIDTAINTALENGSATIRIGDKQFTNINLATLQRLREEAQRSINLLEAQADGKDPMFIATRKLVIE